MEKGESPEAAIVREIREELEVEIEPEKLITTVEYDYPNFHLTMHCFLSRIVSGEIVLTEHEAAKWLDKRELDTVDWLPADVEVVTELKRYLEFEIDVLGEVAALFDFSHHCLEVAVAMQKRMAN